MSESLPSLPERVLDWVRQPQEATYNSLALAAFAYQFERIPAYRRLCETRHRTPEAVEHWQEIPAIPATAFATVELHTDPPLEVFRSSGTRSRQRSVHHHPFPDLYREVIDATFSSFCLPDGIEAPMLSLIPDRELADDSSLGFLVDRILSKHGAAGSDWAFGSRGVDIRKARSWIAARQRDHRPAMILTTGFALTQLLDALEKQNLRFRLAPTSRLFETGGLKGHTRDIPRDQLLARIAERLGIPATSVIREYGMTELTSHFYTDPLRGGDLNLFLPLPWTRVRVLDPVTLEPLEPGEQGILAVFDLANIGSALHLLTEDLGRLQGRGFLLEGRAKGAELRGCSLAAEELG